MGQSTSVISNSLFEAKIYREALSPQVHRIDLKIWNRIIRCDIVNHSPKFYNPDDVQSLINKLLRTKSLLEVKKEVTRVRDYVVSNMKMSTRDVMNYHAYSAIYYIISKILLKLEISIFEKKNTVNTANVIELSV